MLESRSFSVICEPARSLSDHLQMSLKGERKPGFITGIFIAFINTRADRERSHLARHSDLHIFIRCRRLLACKKARRGD